MADNEAPEVREYDVQLNGMWTTMQLNAEDAERLGAKQVDAADDDGDDEQAPARKSRTTPNKSRAYNADTK